MTCCCTGGPAGHQTGYDFRRLFTLSEFHDRDRDSFYAALQQVRVELDLTGWLAYFVHGLATQLAEIRARSEIAIRSDVIARAHNLNPRPAAILPPLPASTRKAPRGSCDKL